MDAAQKKEAEEKERQREEARQAGRGGGRQRNPRAGGSSPGSKTEQEETVRYINKELNPDHEVHESN